MADPILINTYIKSLGLTGKEADLKRKELEKLSTEELNLLISGKKILSEGETYGFDNLKPAEMYNGEQIFNHSFANYGIMGWIPQQAAGEPKKYTAGEKLDLRNFMAEFLLNSTTSAYQAAEEYNKSVGFISIHNGVNNVRKLIGQETSKELEERLKKEALDAENLMTAGKSEGKFEYRFEKITNTPFNLEKAEKLKQKAEEYTILTAYNEKYQTLTEGIKKVKQLYHKETALNQARKRGQVIPEMKESFEEEFLKLIGQFCNGDEKLKSEYIKKISEGITNKKELNEKFLTCLDKVEKDCKAAFDAQLGSKSFEEHTKEFNQLCKSATGKENPELYTKNYIENSKEFALYGEIGVTIATSILLPGSGLMQNAGRNLALKFGEKAAAQIMKARMTVSMGSMPAAITMADALTSESGFTPEKTAEIVEKWKNGLIFGGLGAYVSGPIGNAVERLLLTKPNAITSTVAKVFKEKGLINTAKASGITAETTADVMIDMLLENGDILTSLKTNSGMNIGMMIAGGRISRMIAKSASQIKIQQNTDGSYTLKDRNGKFIFKASDENILATFLFSKMAETTAKAAGDADRTMPNPGKDAAKKLQDKVGLKVDTENAGAGFPQAPRKYDAPSKNLLNVIKHFDPKVMEKRYEALGNRIDECIKKHSSELDAISGDKQAFSKKLIEILAKEFNLQENLKPEILITQFKSGDTNSGYWDWTKGAIIINKDIQDPKDLAKMLSHEFRHVIQYRNLVVRYGEEGLRKLCETAENPEKEFQDVMQNPYTERLLGFAKENPYAKDDIERFMSEIYADEMSNYKDSDHPDYTKQIMEQEAYYLGNNRTQRAYEEHVNGNTADDKTLSNVLKRLKKMAENGEKPETIDKTATTQEQNFTIDEFGQINRNLPAGKVNNVIEGHVTVFKFMGENEITPGMMAKYIEEKRFVLDENGNIDPESPQNKAFLDEINSSSLFSKEELAELLNIDVKNISGFVRSGQLVRHISNKYEMKDKINTQFLQTKNLTKEADKLIQEKTEHAQTQKAQKEAQREFDEKFATMSAVGKQLDIDINVVKYHISMGHLIKDANGKIDLTNPTNKDFIDNFKKGERKPKEKAPEPPVTMDNVQTILGKLPLEYCLKHNLLIADKNGKIDFTIEQNKNFIQKVKDKQITFDDYFVSISEFARRNGNTPTTITRAITDGKVKQENGKIDVNDPVNIEYTKTFSAQAKQNPNMKSMTQIAKMLGFNQQIYLTRYVDLNTFVKEPSGYYDISKEPNKSIIEGIQSGRIPRRKWKDAFTTSSQKEDNPNIKTQTEIAKMKGITQATLSFHTAMNHLERTPNGSIDISTPRNAYFMAHFKKGEEFIPYEKHLEMQSPKAPDAPKPIEKETVNPNLVTMKDFAQMVGITTTPMLIWMQKGAIVRDANKKFDLTNPINRQFIELRQLHAGERYKKMSDEELLNAKEGLKKQLSQTLSTENYIVAKEILETAPDKLDKYIIYTINKSVDVEKLDGESFNALKNTYREILTGRINDKTLPADFSDIKFIEMSSKLNIDIYKTLLERLADTQSAKAGAQNNVPVKYLEFYDAKDGATQTEKEIKAYIEVFKKSSTAETFNELAETYNKCCGENRNEAAAEKLLAELREFNTPEGKIDETTLIDCEDLIIELNREYSKKLEKFNAPEAVKIQEYLQNNDIFPELTEEIGFPRPDNIKENNINEARFLRDIYELHSEDVDIEGIKQTLETLKKSFPGKISEIAEMYFSEPAISKTDFLNAFKDENLKPLQNKLEIFEEWKSLISKNLDITSTQYNKMRTEMNLGKDQIFKDGTDILSTLGYKNFTDFNAYVQNLPKAKADVIFKVFKQPDVASLKKYLKDNGIEKFIIKDSFVKNLKMALSKKPSYLTISLKYADGKNVSAEEHFEKICRLFENANGKITQKESDNLKHTEVTAGTILNEIREQIKQSGLNNQSINHGNYQKILEYIGIETEGRNYRAIQSETYNLSAEQYKKLKILENVLKDDSFDSIITGLHGKMRFVERFMFTSKTDLNDANSVKSFIEVFKYSIEKSLKSGVDIDLYQTGTKGDIIAPKINVNFLGTNLSITLNDKHKIHTIFEKNH